MSSLEDLTEALNFLVEQPDYHELKQEIIILANTRHGRFSGDHYPLNALVEYAREKGGAEWLEPLWTVADKAVTPQEPKETQEPPEPKVPEARFDRKAYQAAYMRAFRDRERKACALMYKLMTPQERKALPRGLVGAPRTEFLERVRSVWQQRKADLLVGVAYPAERNQLSTEFYAELDNQLTAGLNGDLVAARHVLGLEPR